MEFTTADPSTLLSGRADWLDAEAAARLAAHPLDSLETEYPHYVGSVDGPDEAVRPAEDHPVFYGCFDWHSAVHSHWALVRQLRLFDDHPNREAIVASIDDRLTPANVADEVAYLEANPNFEKPYGWAWLLHLAAELDRWEATGEGEGEGADGRNDATEWRETLAPLERTVVDLVESRFLTQDRPFRVGTHGNSAFALHCVLDYARTTDRDGLADRVCETARAFYGHDSDAPVAYEPLGWDFLSPTLTEADLVRRVSDADEFAAWLDGFLPDLRSAPHESLLAPARVDDSPEEGIALHLVGLNLSKAWCLAGLADALDGVGHADADLFREAAADHATHGLSQAFTDDYAGSHWLSSFALYFLTRNEGGIAVGSAGR